MKKLLSSLLLVALISPVIHSCGGGGGGGSDETLAADVSITAAPGTIDPGDRSLITVGAWNVHPDGILLEVRFPVGLTYRTDSAEFEIDGQKTSIRPAINEADATNVYLIFAFDQSDFGSDGKKEGKVTFEIQAAKAGIDGLVEVDPVIREPGVPVSQQFDIANPLFGAKDEDNIVVTGGSTLTPTPSTGS